MCYKEIKLSISVSAPQSNRPHGETVLPGGHQETSMNDSIVVGQAAPQYPQQQHIPQMFHVPILVPGCHDVGLIQNENCHFCMNPAVSKCSLIMGSFIGCHKAFCRIHGHSHFASGMIDYNYMQLVMDQASPVDRETLKQI